MIDRKGMAEQLKQRAHESEQTKDAGLFDSQSYFFIPDGVSRWIPKGSKNGEEHFFDILPFRVGDRYPIQRVESRKIQLQPGEWTYWLDVWIHRRVGPENRIAVCPSKSYGKPCPMCEHFFALLDDEEDDERRKRIWQEKGAKRRCVFNVWVHDNDSEREKGVQIFEVAHFFMEKELRERAKDRKTGEEILYASPGRDGRQIYFKIVSKGGTGQRIEFTGHNFYKRDYEIGDELLSRVVQLDQLLVLHSYDELNEMYWAGSQPGPQPDQPVDEGVGPRRPGPATVSGQAEEDTRASVPSCPVGGEFGKDFNEFHDCERCEADLFEQCRAAKDRMKKDAPRRPRSLGGPPEGDIPF